MSSRRTNLSVVHPNAIAEAIADTAPPAALTVPAIDPLSEFRADAQRRKMDAQGEIDLIDAREGRADKASSDAMRRIADDCDAEVAAAYAKRDRAIEFETQRRDAERTEAMRHRAQHEAIFAGAEAALTLTDAPVEG
jgi:hypothetical protein